MTQTNNPIDRITRNIDLIAETINDLPTEYADDRKRIKTALDDLQHARIMIDNLE